MAAITGYAIAAALLLASVPMPLTAQGQSIYSCVDAKGRRLTSDRPILECLDREQKELNPSGTVKRRLPPSPTAQERALQEEKARQAQAERARLAEEKKRDRALLARYPDQAAHDKERGAALAVADGVIATANKRTATLAGERRKLDTELEFYQKDPSRAPPRLKRQLQENAQQVDEQKRFIATQEAEKQRINARFDEELARLRELWSPAQASPTASAPAAKRAAR